MSFGGSPGDIITAATLALRAYRACKAAAGEFAEVTREVSAVSLLVQDLEEQAASPSFDQDQQDNGKQTKLRSLIDGIIYALRELEELATKYSSLSTTKKNNWDRLRFATKNIDDIRSRLILHTSAAQAILDGLTNRRVTRIESKSDETNAALSRIEQVLADIVKDIKQGSRASSVVSDDRWNIWAELKRELLIEGYPIQVVQQHKDQIKQYLVELLQNVGLPEDVLLHELDPTEIDESINEAHSRPSSQIQPPDPLQFDKTNVVVSNVPIQLLALLLFLLLSSASIAFVRFRQSNLQVERLDSAQFMRIDSPTLIASSSLADKSFTGRRASPSRAREMTSVLIADPNQVALRLKAGLLKNEREMSFSCGSLTEAYEWIDQLSPLFDLELMDESAIKIMSFVPSASEEASRALHANTATSPAQPVDASYCPRDLPQFGELYWDIYSPESPCGH